MDFGMQDSVAVFDPRLMNGLVNNAAVFDEPGLKIDHV